MKTARVLSLALLLGLAPAAHAEPTTEWTERVALARYRIGDAGTLVLNADPSLSVAVVCSARGGDRPFDLSGVELARRGGVETADEGVRCVAVPPNELEYAVWLVTRSGGAPESAAPVEPPPRHADFMVDAGAFAPRRAVEQRLLAIALPPEAAEVHDAIAIVAPRDTALLVALAARRFASLSALASPLPRTTAAAQSTERLSSVAADVTEPLIAYGWAAPRGAAAERAALEVAFAVLAGGAASRLSSLLVGRDMADWVDRSEVTGAEGTVLGLAFAPAGRTSVDRARRFVDGALKQLRVIGPSRGELERGRARASRHALSEWEDPVRRAAALARWELGPDGAEAALERLRALRKVDAESVRKAAATYLVDSRRTTVELYPLLTPTDDPRVAGHRLYTVVRGDTLSDLARRFGVTVASIARANDLDPGRVLTPGQPLYVPPRGAAQDGSAPSLPSRR